MMTNVLHFIRDTLGSRVTPLAYLFAAKAALLGALYGIVQSNGVRNAILFKQDAGVGIEYYGFFLLTFAIAVIVAMKLKHEKSTAITSFVLLLISFWSTIVYIMGGYFDLALLTFFDILMWGYIYLACSIGRLWDYTPALDPNRKV